MRPVAYPETPGWKAETRETFRLAWPLALANLLQMLTYAVDVMFIARLGEQELAASALAVAIFGLVVWGLTALTGAVAPIIAEELGARAPALRPVRRSVRMALWLTIVSGVIGMLLCTQTDTVMRWTGQSPGIAALADGYMMLLIWSLIPMVAAMVLRNFVSALGRPIFATVITGLGIGVNALGNYAFVFGNLGAPALGLEGAAIATIITSVAILAAYVVAIRLDPRLHRYHVFGYFWRPDWLRLAQIVRVGTPIMFTIIAEAGIFGAAAFLMGRIDATQLAAHTIALQIAALAFQIPFGIGQAATIRVGYFYGARDPVGMGRAGWTGIAMAAAFMSMTAIAMVVAPEPLLAIYLDPWAPENAALVAYAIPFLLVAAAFQLVDGTQAVAAGALRGLQDTRVPMWIAIFSYWVPGFGLAAGLGLATQLEGVGVWIGLATGLVFAAGLLTWRWSRREKLGLVQRSV